MGGHFALRIGDQFDLIVLAGATALFLEAANALQQLVVTLFATGFLQAIDDLLQTVFETLAKALRHGRFVVFPTG